MVKFFLLFLLYVFYVVFFFSSRRRHTRWNCDWSSDVCSSDLCLPHSSPTARRTHQSVSGKHSATGQEKTSSWPAATSRKTFATRSIGKRAPGANDRLTVMTLTTGNFKHKLADRGDDLYETPEVAVTALMKVEKLPEVIWEPACGPGSIVRVLRGGGHKVYATDLVDYGCPDSETGQDFLMEQHPSFYIGAIVTNPPFKLAGEFVAHAMNIGVPKIVMLLRLAF